ncbi:MAG: hypothetical protein IPK10_01100 [Bacteroidetes bacterium]|nr:hypothetical protein [Bacteroidota bacterium]
MIIVVGATGLVGRKLMELLLADVTVHKLILLSRNEVEWKHKKYNALLQILKI